MINSWPGSRRFGFCSWLASIRAWTVTPNLSAISLSVSPSCTTYFWPLVAGFVAVAVAAGGGAVVGVGAELGALLGALDGWVVVVGTDVRVPGVVVRAVTAAVAVGGVLPPGRLHALRMKMPPARPATRPSRTSRCCCPMLPSAPSVVRVAPALAPIVSTTARPRWGYCAVYVHSIC